MTACLGSISSAAAVLANAGKKERVVDLEQTLFLLAQYKI
jgi:ATP-dependent protease ClpP protease subunit